MMEPHIQPLGGIDIQDDAPASHSGGLIDRYFQISARGSTQRREVIAGVTTFLAMVYSVFVVPEMLGKAGFDTRAARLAAPGRRFFEVDAAHIVVSVLAGLAETGAVPDQLVSSAIERYGIDGSSADPWSC